LFEAHAKELMDRDVKIPYLKALQGYLWEDGYKSGQLRAPLFPDVAKNMYEWHASGLTIMIYSSGSVPAQKLFFGHTDAEPSNLTHFITDWFDTVNAGLKTEDSSYINIMTQHPEFSPREWLFLSDNPAEVEAALRAGMQSIPVSRPGNLPLPPGSKLAGEVVSNFDSLGSLGLGAKS
jgi:enolase-phosphatase E1